LQLRHLLAARYHWAALGGLDLFGASVENSKNSSHIEIWNPKVHPIPSTFQPSGYTSTVYDMVISLEPLIMKVAARPGSDGSPVLVSVSGYGEILLIRIVCLRVFNQPLPLEPL